MFRVIKDIFKCIFQPWASVPCLNTEAGVKVKGLKPAEVRSALCDAGLSPIGDKNELLKRLAVHYASLSGNRSDFFMIFRDLQSSSYISTILPYLRKQ